MFNGSMTVCYTVSEGSNPSAPAISKKKQQQKTKLTDVVNYLYSSMNNIEKVINWRQRTKQRMIDAFGGMCGVCKYNRYTGALEFHHLDSNEKERGLATMIVNPTSWSKIVIELRKCVCLCSCCHKEIHGGVITLPNDVPKFNENFVEYKTVFKKEMDICPICGNEKSINQKTCSYSCAAKKAETYNWEKISLFSMLNQNMSYRKISEIVGCTDVAVKKREKTERISSLREYDGYRVYGEKKRLFELYTTLNKNWRTTNIRAYASFEFIPKFGYIPNEETISDGIDIHIFDEWNDTMENLPKLNLDLKFDRISIPE